MKFKNKFYLFHYTNIFKKKTKNTNYKRKTMKLFKIISKKKFKKIKIKQK